MLQYKRIYTFLMGCFLLSSCDFSQNDLLPISSEFMKVYTPESEQNIQAETLLEADDAYFILGSLDSTGRIDFSGPIATYPYITKIDLEGKFVWDTVISKAVVNAAAFNIFSQTPMVELEVSYPSDENIYQPHWVEVDNKYFRLVDLKYFDLEFYTALMSFDPVLKKIDFISLSSIFKERGALFGQDFFSVSLAKGPGSSLLIGKLQCNKIDGDYSIQKISLDGSFQEEYYFPDFSNQRCHGSQYNSCFGGAPIPQIGYYNSDKKRLIYASSIHQHRDNSANSQEDDCNRAAYVLQRLDLDNLSSSPIPSFYMIASDPDALDNPGLYNMPVEILDAAGDSLTIATINFNAERVEEIYPEIRLGTSDTALSLAGGGLADAYTFSLQEYDHSKKVMIETLEYNNDRLILYIGRAQDGKILLSVFSEKEQELINVLRLADATQPYEATAYTRTSDGGFAICGQTPIAHKATGLFLIKLSENSFTKSLIPN